MWKWIYILLYVGGNIQIVVAQSPQPAFKHFTVEEGLPSSDVYQVKQDSKGYIWFATGNGVSRYNGYEFKNYSISDGLPDNTVFEIFEDSKGKIWFLPLSGMLSYYENGKIFQYKYNHLIKSTFKYFIKTSFCVDSSETIYIGVTDEGICKITKDGNLTVTKTKDSPDSKLLVQQIGENLIYANSLGQDIHNIKFKTKDAVNGIVDLQFEFEFSASSRMILLKNNDVVFSKYNELIIISPDKSKKIFTYNNKIQWVYEDSNNDIWIGFYMGGIAHVNTSDFQKGKRYLTQKSVTGIIEDRENSFWVTTEGDGVYYMPSKNVLIYNADNGMSDSRANCLIANEEKVYVGLKNGNIYELNEDSIINRYTPEQMIKVKSEVKYLYHNKDENKIHFFGPGLIGTIFNNKVKLEEHGPSYSKLIQIGKSNYWGVNSNGLIHVREPVSTIIALLMKKFSNLYVEKTNRVKRLDAIAIGRKNNTLLLGATDGLWEYNMIDSSIFKIKATDSLLSSRILDMHYGPDSLLILATKGNGVIMSDREYKNVYQIKKRNGLCGDIVFKLYIDNNDIWAATNRGLNLIRITSVNPFAYTIEKFTTMDGLVSNEVNDVIKWKGKIWAATTKGVSFFTLDEINKSTNRLPLHITAVLINDKDTSVARSYVLPYSSNNIIIKYEALEYKRPTDIQYRYKMTELDTNWIYTKNREIQYTTLPAGSYVFLLSVKNPNGKWEKETSIKFTIEKAWWNTWWFRTLALNLLIVSIYLLVNYQFNKIQKSKNEREQINRNLLNLKLKALRAQMNPHFTFNVINSIQHFILYKNDEAAYKYLAKFSKLLRIILYNSEHLSIPIKDEIAALELYLELEAMRFENKFKYQINISPKIDIATETIPSMLIQPYVENSIKHGIMPNTGKEGFINIDIDERENYIVCTITDNGIGRERAALNNTDTEHKSLGTAITKERLASINKLYNSGMEEKVTDLYDEKGKPTGTKVEIYIPIK